MMFLDPTTDLAFKKLFANQARKELVISFLNNVLELKDGDLITDVVFTDPFNHPDLPSSKSSVVDVRCIDQKQRNFIVEMQVSLQSDFRERSQYYAAHALARQLKKSDSFGNAMPVIFVAILDFKLFDNNDHYISHHKTLDAKTYDHELKHLTYCFIELPKFHKKLEELVSVEDKWIYILKHASDLRTVPAQLKTPAVLEEAMSTLEEGAFTDYELAAYEKTINDRRTAESILRTAQEVGLQEGREKGLQEGREEGKLEAAKHIARALLTKNMPLHEVMGITGLSKEEITALEKNGK